MAAIALKRGGSFSSSNDSQDNNNNINNYGGLGYGGGGGGGLYGSTLTSLQYQPQHPPRTSTLGRRSSLARDQSIGSGMGDDLSLVGECDVSSTRSDKHRPGRRASLSAAIELTRSPPKRNPSASSSHKSRGRRNSLFGNNSGQAGKDPASEALSKMTSSKKTKMGSRRASMAAYPAGGGASAVVAEPEPTPQFFQSRKKGSSSKQHKDKDSRDLPDRKKTKSFDKTDAAKAKSRLSSLGKIKRPGGKGGSRRASMSSALSGAGRSGRKGGLKRGSSKNSDMSFKSGNSSFRSGKSGSSSYDLSDEEEEEDVFLNRMAPPRSASYGMERTKAAMALDNTGADDLGYGDPTAYDPRLPPPPKPVPPPSKRSMQNRRGSTGTALSGFKSTSSAQKSLKESLQWKHQAKNDATAHHLSQQLQQNRRASAASSVANSVATDVASNVQRRVPSDVPPSSVLRTARSPSPNPDEMDGSIQFGTPTQSDKPKVQASMLAPSTPTGFTEMSDNDSDSETPLQSNRRTLGSIMAMNGSKTGLSVAVGHGSSASSTMNHVSSLGLMDDSMNSENSADEDPLTAAAAAGARRASRGLSVLRKPSLGGPGASTLNSTGASALGFNPYGSNSNDDDDEEEDEDDEEEKSQSKKQTMADKSVEIDVDALAATRARAPAPAEATPVEAAPILATTITLDSITAGGSVDQHNKNTDDDDGSAGSMTSEAPGDEKAPATADTVGDKMEEIGATGDWSHLVTDDMIKPKAKRNSLLDRYPGSDMDDMDLGYGVGHKATNISDDEDDDVDVGPIQHEYANGYGPADLYDEDYSSFGWREHKPRAANSMEYVNMEQLMSKAKNTKGLYLPTFVPAHGCTNASDFIVRCFVARLRAGMTVTKHSRSRFTKSHDRILHILPTGYHITWIPDTEEEVVTKSKKKAPTKLDLTNCLEVRHAWSRDPKSSRYTGTATLRSKCKDGAANRSFALIFPKRTVDFTAATVDQCKILMEGFSALCFRLQMAKLEQQAADEDTQYTGMSAVEHDNDSTTASLTGTNMSTPWGL